MQHIYLYVQLFILVINLKIFVEQDFEITCDSVAT